MPDYDRVRSLAHDINGLMARALLAAEQLQNHEDVHVVRRADRIMLAIDQVAEICKEELLGKLGVRRVEPLKSDDIDELLGQIGTLASIESRLGMQPTEIHISVDADLVISFSVPQLFRVVFNLVLNSVNVLAHAKPGRIDLSARSCGASVVFTVSDNGPGLPSDLANELRSQTGNEIDLKVGDGTGLATALALAHELGGRLRLTSSTSTGTRFDLTLPLTPASALSDIVIEHAV